MNKSEMTLAVPDLGGVQVLPVMWRQKVKFGMKSGEGDSSAEDESTVLEDITLDTVPSIRMLVSDVVLDGMDRNLRSILTNAFQSSFT